MADLFRAAEAGNLRALRKHLRSGKDCNQQTRSTKATPLIWGTRKKRVRVVKMLLKCEGIDPDIQDSSGNTALHYACRNKDATIAGLLIGAGANLSIENGRNEFALQLSDWSLFKTQCLDQLDSEISAGIASRRSASNSVRMGLARGQLTKISAGPTPSEALFCSRSHAARPSCWDASAMCSPTNANLLSLGPLPRLYGQGCDPGINPLFTKY